MSKTVKILGTGCGKCQQMVSVVQEVVADHQLEVMVEKVEGIAEIMEFNVMTTPALVVDGVVMIKGRVPSKDEVLGFLK
jgi:small redox-active disulfide protein 2